MLSLAAHVSCESASEILAEQGIKVSGDTLINLLKEEGSQQEHKSPKMIGVDDWAYRKGQKYGTIICDLETHEVIDVLKGRDSETFEKWLKEHPGIEIVSRDRASSYSSAVTNVFPDAIQIADRFHITKNLLDALKETLKEFLPQKIVVPNIDSEKTEPEPCIEQKTISRIVKKTQKRKNAKIPK